MFQMRIVSLGLLTHRLRWRWEVFMTIVGLCGLLLTVRWFTQQYGRDDPEIVITSLETGYGYGQVYVIDLREQKAFGIPDNTYIGESLRWCARSGRILFVSWQSEARIHSMDMTGNNIEDLAIGSEPSWSPDCRHIVFTISTKGQTELMEMNWDGSDPHRLNRTGKYISNPVYAPNGIQIAFAYHEENATGLAILDISSGQLQRIVTDQDGFFTYLRWSPDGKSLLFKYSGTIEVLSLVSHARWQIARCAGDAVWSPNGNQIAYVDYCDATKMGEVYITDMTGRMPRTKITSNVVTETKLQWSGNLLIFVTVRNSGSGYYPCCRAIAVVSADGSNEHTVSIVHKQRLPSSPHRQFAYRGVNP
jgi:Tol biopolymer transport system component